MYSRFIDDVGRISVKPNELFYVEDRLTDTIKPMKFYIGCDHWTILADTDDVNNMDDDDVDMYSGNDFEYNVLWRCWPSMPSERDRKTTPWKPIDVDLVYKYLKRYRIKAIEACDNDGYSDDFQVEYDKAIIVLKRLIEDNHRYFG